MAMKNPKSIPDGWYVNKSDNPVSMGVFTFKPGQWRWVPADQRLRCANGFENAMAKGWVEGPMAVKGGEMPPKKVAAAEPAPPPPPPAPEPEPEPEVAPEPEPEPEPEPKPEDKPKKRRRRKDGEE